jgi:hypothetical protein
LRQSRWGEKRAGGRNWKEHDERLVVRGEAYVSLDFLESWTVDIGELNRGKVGAPFQYPESLMTFTSYVHTLLHVDFRGLQGFIRGLRRIVGGGFEVPYCSQICRRVNALDLSAADTLLPYEGEDVVVSLDSTGVKVADRGEWMRRKWKVHKGWIRFTSWWMRGASRSSPYPSRTITHTTPESSAASWSSLLRALSVLEAVRSPR